MDLLLNCFKTKHTMVRQYATVLLLAYGLFLLPARAQSQLALLDSLEKASLTGPDTLRISALTELCYQYSTSDKTKALKFGLEGLALAEGIQHNKWIAQACNDLGMVHHRMGNYEAALPYYQRALEIRKAQADKRGCAAVLSKIGSIYTEQGKYELALETQLQATRVFEELGEKRAIAYSYNGLARLLEMQKQFDQAIIYRQRAFAAAQEIQDKTGMAGAITGIALNYQSKGQHKNAVKYFLQSLQIIRQTTDKPNLAAALNNVGHSYHQLKQDDRALKYFTEALALSEELGDKKSNTLYRLNIAEIYKTTDPQKAIAYCNQALAVAQQHKFANLEAEAFNILADINTAQQRYEQAYQNLQKHVQAKDSLLNEAAVKSMAEMQTRYETERKDNQIRLMRQQAEIQELQLERNRSQRNLLALGMMFLLTGTGATVLVLRARARQRLQKALLAEQENRLRAVIETQEAERKRIAEDLHDSLGQLLCLARMSASSLREAHEPVNGHASLWKNLDTVMNQSIDEVRAVAHTMMPSVLVKIGITEALRELADYYNATGKLKLHLTLPYLDYRPNSTTEIALYRIAQELLGNITKHAHATQAHLSLTNQKGLLCLEVKDNGRGFDSKQIKTGSGNGWYNLQSRVALLHGELIVDSEPGKGTTVAVYVPNAVAELAAG